MDWSERMNAAVDYIEENLAGEIDFNKAAEKAACSIFHFQRIFFAINGLTPVEYARRRKLTMAAMELAAENVKVIDVAMKYGYDSPNAFARAFRQLHGITPQAAREPGVKLTAFPRVSFHIELKGENDMDYKIIKKPAFTVAGKIRRFTTNVQQNMMQISQWWEEFGPSQAFRDLLDFGGNKPGIVTGGVNLGICFQKESSEVWYYAIAVELPKGKSPKPYDILEVPASTWAVFETTLDDISKCWTQIFTEWFPSTGYEHASTPEMEVYLPGNPDNPATWKCQIWVPVIKKNRSVSSRKK